MKKICVIVVEYNPFHNGHIYHANKARELTNCDVLIGIMSGNFVQRGEVAIIDKWKRVNTALDYGLDLIVELPYIYANQSASNFAKGAITIAKLLKANYLVFGSEINDIEVLKELASVNINVDNLKENMKKGYSFPYSYSLLAGSYYPNDILGIAYLKELNNTNIIPMCIQRTNNYYDLDINNSISSASAIRNATYNNKEISHTTKMTLDYHNCNDNYFNYLKLLLMTLPKSQLKNIFLVNEGIENHLFKTIKSSDNYDDFINKSITKRYTKGRIQRVCMNIINHITTDEVANLKPLDYIRPLGFNKTGQLYLKDIKKQLYIASDFSMIPKGYQDMEIKTTYTYISVLDESIKKEVLKRELSGPIIK